jgi:hypothetical protein
VGGCHIPVEQQVTHECGLAGSQEACDDYHRDHCSSKCRLQEVVRRGSKAIQVESQEVQVVLSKRK